jgi:hypothetical protein
MSILLVSNHPHPDALRMGMPRIDEGGARCIRAASEDNSVPLRIDQRRCVRSWQAGGGECGVTGGGVVAGGAGAGSIRWRLSPWPSGVAAKGRRQV